MSTKPNKLAICQIFAYFSRPKNAIIKRLQSYMI